MIVWLQFFACAAVITFAGAKLSKYGDVIAEKTGLGRTWIGITLMAAVTSLPELITGASSILVFDLPDIAVGDVLGSCMFNVLIIAFLDIRCGEKPIASAVSPGQILTAGLSLLLLAIANVALLAQTSIPAVGWFGVSSPMIFATYLLAMRLVFIRNREAQAAVSAQPQKYQAISARHAATIYSVNALLVVAAASWLPRLGEKIAELTGLGHTFVGSLFIAGSTSLPEIVVSFSALRMGAPNLALGNLFGSNLFNIAVLAVDDFLYTKGPLLTNLTGNHSVTIGGALILTAIMVISMAYQPAKKRFCVGWDSLSVIVVFVSASWLVYVMG